VTVILENAEPAYKSFFNFLKKFFRYVTHGFLIKYKILFWKFWKYIYIFGTVIIIQNEKFSKKISIFSENLFNNPKLTEKFKIFQEMQMTKKLDKILNFEKIQILSKKYDFGH